MIKLNDETFLQAISNGISVIKFSAEWCGPCKTLHPIMEEVERTTGVAVYEVDIDENAKIVELLGIRAVPTVMIFKDGLVEGTPQVGARSLSTYVDLIELVKNSVN